MEKKKSDLAFEREVGPRASEGIEFYIDENYLEIQTWNADSDVFTIILEPTEILQIKHLLNKLKDLPNYLFCHTCNKCVSTGFVPVPTDTPDKGLIVRAYIECPECIEKRMKKEE